MSELGLPESRDSQLNARICSFCNEMVREAVGHPDTIRRFPGTMALSLSRRHLHMIATNDYVALEKSDGVRYMLLALPDFVVLLDRRMRVYIIDPNPQMPSFQHPSKPQENTLLDGELTKNLALDVWEYLIYDAVAIDGDLSVAKMSFRERLRQVETFVAAPRVWSPAVSGLLRLRVKDYYEKDRVRDLFRHIKKDAQGHYIYVNHARRDGVVCNENDGVIFTPCGLPYTIKNCPALLKWKPPHLNSIDFALQLERTVDPRTSMPSVRSYIAFRSDSGNQRLREVFFPSKHKRHWASQFNEYNNSIVELSYDRKCGEWRYLRRREDKEVPNFSGTVIDTMESIAESLDREELISFLETHSKPPPRDAIKTVHEQIQSRAACTYTDDLFDDRNLSYAVTTPISLVRPPIPRPRHGTRGFGGHRGGGGGPGGGPSGRYGGGGGAGAKDRPNGAGDAAAAGNGAAPDLPVYEDV